MNESTPLPSAISHKELPALLSAAKKDALPPQKHDQVEEQSEDQKEFENLLLNWSSLSKELLKTLKKKQPDVFEGRNTKSLMALGALEAHLFLAIQAQEASESEYEA